MAEDSNIDEVNGLLMELADAFDFTKDNLGDDLLDVAVEGIVERSAEERGPEGEWNPNKGRYGEAKRKAGVKVGVSYRKGKVGGEMLSARQIRGRREVTRDEATMTYGTNGEAQAKAEYFSPERPFYELDDDIEGRMEDLLSERLIDFIAEKQG